MLKELNSLVELFKLSLACKWRERERKALSGHIYTLPECNPLSRSRGSSTAREGIEHAPHLWPGGSYLGSASTWPHTQGAASEYLIVEAGMVRVLPVELESVEELEDLVETHLGVSL